MADHAVHREPVSAQNSLLTGKNNREFFEFRPAAVCLRQTNQMFPDLFSRIPYSTEQRIFSTKQGIISKEQDSDSIFVLEKADAIGVTEKETYCRR